MSMVGLHIIQIFQAMRFLKGEKMNKITLKKAVERAFKEYSSVEDVFMMLYHAKYMIIDSWSEIEYIIEEIFGERPNWQECKRKMREDE